MPLPSSGQITMNDVNVEIRKPSTNQVDLDNADVRLTFEVASGQISMNDGYGKCFCEEYSIIYDNGDNTVQFTANQCDESRTFVDVNEFGPGSGGDFYGTICIVKNSLSTSQNPLNYTNTGCC
jgi:hypothetical protein